jgi:tripartite-type tricarboxylate transporter receptor subunit TctC
MAPGGTPAEVVARLQRELSAILKSPEVTEQFRKLGAETVGDTSEQFGRTIASEYETWARVIRDGKLKFE